MKPINEEQLMAFADGELDAGTAREVQSAIDADPALAGRVERHRELRNRVHAAYRPVLEEPVPPRLLSSTAAAPAAAPVIELAARRAARLPPPPSEQPPRRAGNWAAWGGLAAGLLIGILIGRLPGVSGSSDESFARTSAGLAARGEIAQVLTNRLASEPLPDRQVALQISFVDDAGRYCRTFTTPVLAGLACREGAEWMVQSLQQTGGGTQSGMRQAASALPQELLELVDRRMRGGALDAAAERAALERGWQR